MYTPEPEIETRQNTTYWVTSTAPLPDDLSEEDRAEITRLRAERAAQAEEIPTQRRPERDEQGYTKPFPREASPVYAEPDTRIPSSNEPMIKINASYVSGSELAEKPGYAPYNPTPPQPVAARRLPSETAPSIIQQAFARFYMRLIQWGEILAAAGGSIMLFATLIFLADEFSSLYPEMETLGLEIDPFTFIALSIFTTNNELLNFPAFLFTPAYRMINGLLQLSTNNPAEDYCGNPTGMLVPYAKKFKVITNNNFPVYSYEFDLETGCFSSKRNGTLTHDQLSARFPQLQYAASNELALNRTAIAIWLSGTLAFTIWFAKPDNVEAHDKLLTGVLGIIELILKGAIQIPLLLLQGMANIALLPFPQRKDTFNITWNNSLDKIALWLSNHFGQNTIMHVLQTQQAAGLPKSIIGNYGRMRFSSQFYLLKHFSIRFPSGNIYDIGAIIAAVIKNKEAILNNAAHNRTLSEHQVFGLIFGIQTATDIDRATRKIATFVYADNHLQEHPPLDRRGLRNELLAAIKMAMREIQFAEPDNESTQTYIKGTERSMTVLALHLYQLLHRERAPHLVDKALSGGYPKQQNYLFETCGIITQDDTTHHYHLKPYDHAQRDEQLPPFKTHLIAKFPVLYAILMTEGYGAALRALDLSRPRKWNSEKWQNYILPNWQAYFRELAKETISRELRDTLREITERLGFIYGLPVPTSTPIPVPPATEGTPLVPKDRRKPAYDNKPGGNQPRPPYNKLQERRPKAWDDDDSSDEDDQGLDNPLYHEISGRKQTRDVGVQVNVSGSNSVYDDVTGLSSDPRTHQTRTSTQTDAADTPAQEIQRKTFVDVKISPDMVYEVSVQEAIGTTQANQLPLVSATTSDDASDTPKATFELGNSHHRVSLAISRQRPTATATASIETQADDQSDDEKPQPAPPKPVPPAIAPKPRRQPSGATAIIPAVPAPTPRKFREQPHIKKQPSSVPLIDEFFSHANVCNLCTLVNENPSDDPIIISLRDTDQVLPAARKFFETDTLDKLHKILKAKVFKNLDEADQKSTETTLERDSVILGMRLWKHCDSQKTIASGAIDAARTAIQRYIQALAGTTPSLIERSTQELLEHKTGIYSILLDTSLLDGETRNNAISAFTRLITREWLANRKGAFFPAAPVSQTQLPTSATTAHAATLG